MTYATYGLPRYVIAILHIMEAHKDCLKWTVSERSHKLSLTLTWDFKFRDGKVKKTFWEKLQKTLKGGGSNNSGGSGGSGSTPGVSGGTKSGSGSNSGSKMNVDELTSEIPRNLIRFIKHLEMETKEEERGLQMARQSLQRASQQRLNNIGTNNMGSNKTNQHQSSSALKRQQRWSRYSLQSLPVRYQSNSQTHLARLNDANTNVNVNQHVVGSGGQKQTSGYKQAVQNQRYNAMKSFASYHQLPTRDILSPYHGEWPDGSFEASSDPVDDGCVAPENIIASGGPAAVQIRSKSGGGHRINFNQMTNVAWTNGRGLKTVSGIGPEQNDMISLKPVRQPPETSSASCRGDDLDDDSEFNETSIHAGPSNIRRTDKRHTNVTNHKATSGNISSNATRKQSHPSRISTNSEHRRSTSVGSSSGGGGAVRGVTTARRREMSSAPLSANNQISSNKLKEVLTSMASHCPLMPQTNSAAAAVTSDSDSASELQSDEDDSERKQTVNQTVIRCLDSCDKILFRHSTTIT
ncbi:hypothetical protein HELRODRAFT_194231 [Helobdella robusta]|uniref:Uncharacterized protein n=1 Tax=Helobdella robusta TaxID=6412 RepID=T1FVU3_HELRO|nr:hypothetical protein HELRODRAFT_194231 [Helobdella robusta]ESN92533.1 hypothetical protein HELRODRAFT_194231 [Helobdella robusta]